MNPQLEQKCQLLADNRILIKKKNFWEASMLKSLGAMLYTVKGAKVDPEVYGECKKLLRRKKGIFSQFRGYASIAVISKMALSGRPEQTLDDITEIFKQMKQVRWVGNLSRLMTALVLYDSVQISEVPRYVDLTDQIFHKMRKTHPWLTDWTDVPFAALLAVSDKNTDALFEDMEECYGILKKRFFVGRDAVQGLSQILSLSDKSPEVKCDIAKELHKELRHIHKRFNPDRSIATLGAFADVPLSVPEAAQAIKEADDFLKHQRHFGAWSISPRLRRMFSAAMVIDQYVPDSVTGSSAITASTISIVIIEELILMMIIATAAASSSHSSSSSASA